MMELCSLPAILLLLVSWNTHAGARQASLQEHWHGSMLFAHISEMAASNQAQPACPAPDLLAVPTCRQYEASWAPELCSAACRSAETELHAMCLQACALTLLPPHWQQEPVAETQLCPCTHLCIARPAAHPSLPPHWTCSPWHALKYKVHCIECNLALSACRLRKAPGRHTLPRLLARPAVLGFFAWHFSPCTNSGSLPALQGE